MSDSFQSLVEIIKHRSTRQHIPGNRNTKNNIKNSDTEKMLKVKRVEGSATYRLSIFFIEKNTNMSIAEKHF